MTIAEVAAEARKEGLTYGEYVRLYGPSGPVRKAEAETEPEQLSTRSKKKRCRRRIRRSPLNLGPRYCLICGTQIPGEGEAHYGTRKYCSDKCREEGKRLSNERIYQEKKQAYQERKEKQMDRLTMKIALDKGAYLPERAHKTDAGLDLRTPVRAYLPAGGSVSIDTGLHVELPHGYYGKIESKSGLNVRQGIVSCGGVIDEGYTGSIAVKLYNLSGKPYTFEVGDKIAQLIVQPCAAPELYLVARSELEDTERGDAGFGSTGR